MATVNIAGNHVTYGIGGLIAIIVLIVCVVLLVNKPSDMTIWLIAGLAIARLT